MMIRLHKPRFRLSGLAVLVAVLAVVFATLSAEASPFVAGFVLLAAAVQSVIDGMKTGDWFVLWFTLGVVSGLAFAFTRPPRDVPRYGCDFGGLFRPTPITTQPPAPSR